MPDSPLAIRWLSRALANLDNEAAFIARDHPASMALASGRRSSQRLRQPECVARVATIFPNCYRTRRGFHLRRFQVTLSAAKLGARVGGVHMKSPEESASALIDEKIKELGDWRGKMLAKVRQIIHAADPEIVEEWKWVKPTNPGTPVWSHGGIVCTGETYKNAVKMTFAKGAALEDPSGLFNSSLDGNARRAIDIHEGDKVDEAALTDLIRAAVALNLMGKSKPRNRTVRGKPQPRRAGSKRAD